MQRLSTRVKESNVIVVHLKLVWHNEKALMAMYVNSLT